MPEKSDSGSIDLSPTVKEKPKRLSLQINAFRDNDNVNEMRVYNLLFILYSR